MYNRAWSGSEIGNAIADYREALRLNSSNDLAHFRRGMSVRGEGGARVKLS